MSRTTSAVLFSLCFAFLSAGAVPARAQIDKPRTPPAPPAGEVVVPQMGGGMLPLDEATWAGLFADEPALAFETASREIAKGDLHRAGHFVLKAAAHTRIAAYRSKDELKQELFGRERRLRELGETLEKGKTVPESVLSRTFAQDLEALAEQHLVNAEKSWLDGKAKSTGTDLGAAVFDLDHSLVWNDVPLKDSERSLLSKGRSMAVTLEDDQKGKVQDKDEVARILSDLIDLASSRRSMSEVDSG